MNRTILIGSVLALAIAAGAAYYFLHGQEAAPAEETAAPAPAVTPAPSAAAAGEEHHPVPSSGAGEPFAGTLAESDGAMRQALDQVFGKGALDALLIPHNLIRHLVATIVSLDGDPVAMRMRPLAHVPGLLVVDSDADHLVLSAQNAARYTPYVDLLNRAGAKPLAAIYLRFYPLFQSAYEELGYKGQYFNDRLVKVIDHLLATPVVSGPIHLVRPKVLYEFEDSTLEERSSGQKLLIRMGVAQATVVKAWLAEIRKAVVADAPQR